MTTATRRWVRRRRPYTLYGPKVTVEKLNEMIATMWLEDNGGHIKIRGRGRPFEQEGSVLLQPGVILEMVGQPMPYHLPSTYARPYTSDFSVVLQDGAEIGKREAWGSSALINWTVDAQIPGVNAVLQKGGNRSIVTGLTSSQGKYPLEHFILIDQNRWHDGQYSIWERAMCTRAKYPLEVRKNVPDTRFLWPMLYGNRRPGGVGVWLHEKVNNCKFVLPDVQFNWRGWDIGGYATLVMGGSWENRSGGDPYADSAIVLRGTSWDTTFRDYDFANFDTLLDRSRILVTEPGARKYTFDLPTGHRIAVQSQLTDEQAKHFRWSVV